MVSKSIATILLLLSTSAWAERSTVPRLITGQWEKQQAASTERRSTQRGQAKKPDRSPKPIRQPERARKGDLVSRGGNPCRVVDVLSMTITAYHPNCRTCGTGIRTATGASAMKPGIAVDPRVVKLKSPVILVIGNKIYDKLIADDTGAKIKGRRGDLRLQVSHEEAIRFSHKPARVLVLQPD